jgi:hypothetical protein
MIIRNAIGLLLILAYSIYQIFGNPDNMNWSKYYFILSGLIAFFICYYLLIAFRDKLFRIIIITYVGIKLYEFTGTLIWCFNLNIFTQLNKSIELSVIFTVCLFLFLLIKRIGL